jgi:hypothetical protein
LIKVIIRVEGRASVSRQGAIAVGVSGVFAALSSALLTLIALGTGSVTIVLPVG